MFPPYTLVGPLMPDLSNSSNTVVSPPKIPTKLRCVFQGGEPPIRVSISRHYVMIAYARGRTLSFVIKPHIYDDGQFVCRATDARNRTVTHKINLHVPGKTSKKIRTLQLFFSLTSIQTYRILSKENRFLKYIYPYPTTFVLFSFP